MKPFRNGGVYRNSWGEVRMIWRMTPLLLFCVLGLLFLFRLQDAMHEDFLKKEQEKAEMREMVRRIDERTERLERSCMEVCGD